ncbi:hypothetical protein RRG08_058692 [Elysia crispata]|uniref:Uncharacterized protein n=1 Tax=Elysia crispata TaxID=231223 RepID=A0AAE0YWN5_9GAST|nr:hypothetical protein RRG08_058692 [Elysia crispata]
MSCSPVHLGHSLSLSVWNTSPIHPNHELFTGPSRSLTPDPPVSPVPLRHMLLTPDSALADRLSRPIREHAH